MKVGTLVALICADDDTMPVGASGVIVGAEDEDGDYLVCFPDRPCPAGPDTNWYAHRTWLVPLTPQAEAHERAATRPPEDTER